MSAYTLTWIGSNWKGSMLAHVLCANISSNLRGTSHIEMMINMASNTINCWSLLSCTKFCDAFASAVLYADEKRISFVEACYSAFVLQSSLYPSMLSSVCLQQLDWELRTFLGSHRLLHFSCLARPSLQSVGSDLMFRLFIQFRRRSSAK